LKAVILITGGLLHVPESGLREERFSLTVQQNSAAGVVVRPVERKFLGFSFTAKGRKRRIAPKEILRFKRKVRELRGISLEQLA
jgi:hypothetical protein